jgi:hypothetical protein
VSSIRGVSCGLVDSFLRAEYNPLNHTNNLETKTFSSFVKRLEPGSLL